MFYIFYDDTFFNKISYAAENTSYCRDVSVEKKIKNLEHALATSLNIFMRTT